MSSPWGGPAILGRLGASPRIEAAKRITVGETVNMASRLEGMTKELYVQVAVSKHTSGVSGLKAGEGMALQMMEVRGFNQTTAVYPSKRVTDHPGCNAQST